MREHPEWFRHRPDGTIKYAENPPKKYQDIYPLNFEGEEWRSLWQELKSVFDFWIGHGVTIFRVDNPHTKPLPFWEWALAEIRREHPEAIFLSEAFTRPKIMRYLAKAGFSQSYSYFTWRNTAPELVEYFTELTQTDVREYLRPNLFANTPGHPARVPAARRQAGVRRPSRPRGDAGGQLRHLQRVRAVRERAGQARQRGVPRLREVSDPDPRLFAAGQPLGADRAG